MVDYLQEFLARHRRKFIVTGVLVGGTFFALRYAQRKLLDFQERKAREFLERTRRLQHFESTERTCNQVVIGMGAELCQAIISECSTDDLLAQLRHNPPNKLELWEDMKLVAFTRLTTFIYATSMLVVVLRVQLNLLGGYLYRDEGKQITQRVKQQYLSLIRHFIYDGGLSALVRLLRAKVNAVMKQMPLTKRLSLTDLEQLFWSLQMAINSDDAGDPNSKMARYLLPPQVPDTDPLLQKMFNETLDLLESDDASNICSNNICRGFSIAVDAIAETLDDTIATVTVEKRNDAGATPAKDVADDAAPAPAPVPAAGAAAGDGVASTADEGAAATATATATAPADGPAPATATATAPAAAADAVAAAKQNTSSSSNNNNNTVLMNVNKVEIALAKLIPIVSGLTSKGFDSSLHPQNLATSLVTFFVVAEKTKILGANVYETFSSS